MASYIIYDGPSQIDGKPVVCIFQEGSSNTKTGNMAQTYILVKDTDPVTANRKGLDKSICGSCPHMGKPNDNDKGQATDRTCYVTLAHGPLNKYKGMVKGLYDTISGHKAISEVGFGHNIRVGTYGDPAAIPNYVWESLLSGCKGWTAYTHNDVNLKPNFFMTSADTHKQAQAAWGRGERTFRVLDSEKALDNSHEIFCPATPEGGSKANCFSCGLCKGSSLKGKSIAVLAHGTSKRKAKEMIGAMQ